MYLRQNECVPVTGAIIPVTPVTVIIGQSRLDDLVRPRSYYVDKLVRSNGLKLIPRNGESCEMESKSQFQDKVRHFLIFKVSILGQSQRLDEMVVCHDQESRYFTAGN